MARYRKRPFDIEAVQWYRAGDHPAVVPLPLRKSLTTSCPEAMYHVRLPGYAMEEDHPPGAIYTRAGWQLVLPGDWILQDAQGIFSTCTADVFAATYERVHEGN